MKNNFKRIEIIKHPIQIKCKYCEKLIMGETEKQIESRLNFHLSMNKKCKEIRKENTK